ncbi:MAG TPA: 2-octaprenyl-3-methyl-6-methoxy-1,4-benzoquinol hydroxylase, partial [Gammaproteobacteria bacterium]|nr:2-octaprenyl-3-methyl-6-methoxy-1,4-benzoquinol hydroxylase [Gammaproteobacteria bacterium]
MADPIDIVVAGGGMVGSAFAAALADSPLQIHVINAHSPSAWQEHHYDPRVSAINLASESILSSVDSWQHVRERRVAPFREIEVSDQATGQMLCFDAADSGLAHLGHIVENSAITDALRLRLEAAPNVTVSQDDRVQSVNHAQGQILVSTEQHQVITARL